MRTAMEAEQNPFARILLRTGPLARVLGGELVVQVTCPSIQLIVDDAPLLSQGRGLVLVERNKGLRHRERPV